MHRRTLKRIFQRDHFRCQHCGAAHKLTCHHIKPKHAGGLDDLGNLITLCQQCHDAQHRTVTP
jgi:5-methylcytosine-specific restriction endonuclease McrA